MVNGAAALRRVSRVLTEATRNAAPSSAAMICRGLLAVGDLGLLAVDLGQVGREHDRRTVAPAAARGDRPVLARDEGADLALAVDDQPHRDRLHAPGGEPAADLGPQQRRDLVADQPVEDAPRLLRVDARHVDRVGVLERRQRGVLGDLVQLDALGVLELQQLGEMPRDRLALAIGVGRQVHFGRRLRRRLELLDDVALPFDGQVARREDPLCTSTPSVRLGQVADVPDRRLHDVARAARTS